MSFKFVRWCTCYDAIDADAPEVERQAKLGESKKHRIRVYKLRSGPKKFKLLLLNHTDCEVQREMVLAAMGGQACPCVMAARRSKEFQKGAVVAGRTYAE